METLESLFIRAQAGDSDAYTVQLLNCTRTWERVKPTPFWGIPIWLKLESFRSG